MTFSVAVFSQGDIAETSLVWVSLQCRNAAAAHTSSYMVKYAPRLTR
jgi:hypothetical protein